MKKLLQGMGYLLGIALLLNGCDLGSDPLDLENKTTEEQLQTAGRTVEDNSNAQLNAVKVFENVNNYGISEEGIKSAHVTGDEPAVSWDDTHRDLTLDFSTVTGASGSILVHFSGVPFYTTQNLQADITFDNYKNNGTGLSGEITLIITSFIPNTSAAFTFKTVGDVTVDEDGSSYLWNCDQQISWISGVNTLTDFSDDSYTIDGTADYKKGDATSAFDIQEPLVFEAGCEYVTDGVLQMTYAKGTSDELVVTSDFGVGATDADQGQCDGWVKLSTSDLTIKINLDQY